MVIDCEVVRDLLPLYADGVCSLESMHLVEDHFRECGACRMEYERMTSKEGQPAPAPDAAAVIKKTAREMTIRSMLSAAGVAAIIIYWVVYAWESSMADGGDFRYFSYSFHELWSGSMVLLVPFLTLAWLIVRFWMAKKQRAWRRSAPMLILLAALFAGQIWYLSSWVQSSTTYSACTVLEVVDEYHIEVLMGIKHDGPVVTLEAAPSFVNLMEEGETYNISFRHKGGLEDATLLYVYGRTETLG